MVLTFLWEKFNRSQKLLGIATREGFLDSLEREVAIQHIGLSPKFARRMGIGISNKRDAFQLIQSPVHRRIRRQSRFNNLDMWGKFAKTFFQRIKTGVGSKYRKVGGPDMGCTNRLPAHAPT